MSTWHDKTTIQVPVGLANDRNNCYINAVLQCLVAIYPYVGKHTQLSSCTEVCVPCEIDRIYETNNTTILSKFTQQDLSYLVGSFRKGEQQDAHEFLCGAIHCELSGLNNFNFGGTEMTITRCKDGHVSQHSSPFLSLETYPTGSSVQDCIDNLGSSVALEDENRFDCEGCQKLTDATRETGIASTKKNLIIHMNRFETGNTKNPSVVMNSPEIKITTINKEITRYTLVGAVEHIGSSIKHGHYRSYTRTISGEWYQQNDSVVSRINVSELKTVQSYLLFYVESKDVDKITTFSSQSLTTKKSVQKKNVIKHDSDSNDSDDDFTMPPNKALKKTVKNKVEVPTKTVRTVRCYCVGGRIGKTKLHFHCRFCQRTLDREDRLKAHVEKCEGKAQNGCSGSMVSNKAGSIGKGFTGLSYQRITKTLFMVRGQKNGLKKPVYVKVEWNGGTTLTECSAHKCKSLEADIQRWGKGMSFCNHVLSVQNINNEPKAFAEYKDSMTMEMDNLSEEYKDSTLKPYLKAASENGHPPLVPFEPEVSGYNCSEMKEDD